MLILKLSYRQKFPDYYREAYYWAKLLSHSCNDLQTR